MDVEETNPYFPLKEFITFNAPLKADALINKLKEFNSQVANLLSSERVHHLQNAPLKAEALINKLKEFNSQVANLLSSQGVHHLQCSP
jgi:hypothetical protein